jgi:serine protease Do
LASASNLAEMASGFLSGSADLVEAVRPSIVQVLVHRRGAGAGVIWDAAGSIVTNHHVVADAEQVQVLLGDGRSVTAAVVRREPSSDLALLRIPAGGLSAAIIRGSSDLRVGELVFAIGHPWGLRDVVTAGIVSGTGEVEVRWGGRRVELIRSDVRLAPGNSGGPLIDAAGRVIGINSMILGGDLSVAIPSTVVQRWLVSESVPAGAARAA